MRRKHGGKDSQIKVITDPKKLAWLQSQIEKRKASGTTGVALKKARSK